MLNLKKKTILANVKPFDPLTRLDEFEKKFPFEMQILLICGVHPTKDVKMNNPYTGEPHDESFTNVGEHCLAVASVAGAIAKKLYQKNAISRKDVELAIIRALLHDANKRLEVMRRNAAKTGAFKGAYHTQGAHKTIRPILLRQGINRKLVDYIVGVEQEAGHLNIRKFLVLRNSVPSLVSGKMIEKIIHLADDVTSTSIPLPGEKASTVFLTPCERMLASDFLNRYPFLWKEGLAFNKQGKIVVVKDTRTVNHLLNWAKPYAYWQPFVSNMICQEIQVIIDPQNKQKPEYFVKDLVNNALF